MLRRTLAGVLGGVLEHPALALSASGFIYILTGVGIENRWRLERMVRPLVEVPSVCRDWVVAFCADEIIRLGHRSPHLTTRQGRFPAGAATI